MEKMQENELISIVIPIYRVEKYLHNCIESVLKQTYRNIEIILVDDGSPDNCPEICDEYAKKDGRIKVIHKKNGGLSEARNFGIESAKGNYITFIDSDDDVELDYIEYLYMLIKNNNVNMSIATYKIINGNSKKDYFKTKYEEKVLDTKECLEDMLCEKNFTVSACAKLYKKNLFKDIKFPVGKLCEDNGTTYKLILKCTKIAFGSKEIYNYYKRENSIMTMDFSERRLDLLELTEQMCIDIYNAYPEISDSIEKKRVTAKFSILRQMVNSNLNKNMQKEQGNLIKYIKENKKRILKNSKMDNRDKIALISLLIGKGFFAISWKIYYLIKYKLLK